MFHEASQKYTSTMNTGEDSTKSTRLPKQDTDDSDGIQQIALSVTAVACSAVVGMYITAKKEQTKLKAVVGSGSPAIIATKALLYGSALAIGTFAAGTSLFVAVSGVRSFKEVGDYVDRTFRTPEGYRRACERRERDRLEADALAAKYPHLNKAEILWKQLRFKEELQNEDDEIDEQVVEGKIPPPEPEPVPGMNADGTPKEKNSNSIFHIAYLNLQKILKNIVG